MRMDNEKKKEILLKNFEIINKNFGENGRAMREVILKMFPIDLDTALDMWKYLIKEYEGEVKNGDSWCLTGGIYFDGAKIIGSGKMDNIVLATPELKRAIFSLAESVNLSATIIIRNAIENNNSQLANELLQLLYDNPYKEKSWYYIMDEIMPYSDSDISEDVYELMEMWCDKVESEEERAELRIKMLDYIK